MRLYEIENINRSIIVIKRLSEDYEKEFSILHRDLQIFKKLKGIRLNNFLDNKIIPFRQKLNEFLSTQFYEDPDIDKIKIRLTEMLNQLQ
jgi:hypothetical protein